MKNCRFVLFSRRAENLHLEQITNEVWQISRGKTRQTLQENTKWLDSRNTEQTDEYIHDTDLSILNIISQPIDGN